MLPIQESAVCLPYMQDERMPKIIGAKGIQFFDFPEDLGDMEDAMKYLLLCQSLVYNLNLGLRALKAAGFSCDRIILAGGGANDPIFQRIIPDITNLPCVIPDNPGKLAMRGAALSALWAYLRNRGYPDLALGEVASYFADDWKLIKPRYGSSLLRTSPYIASQKNFEKRLYIEYGVAV